ncbi:MAG: ABC transporter substrate-binding protein [Planctomycetota bacterium]|nr:ABC transporter substrate-binding protein [Planctomycetota bacterium]
MWRGEAGKSLKILGEALGLESRANAIATYMASIEDDLRRRTGDVPDSGKPSVYFGGISYKGAHGIESTEGGYPPARMVGARNVADATGKKGHFFVDKERILVWNPDYIFIDVGSRQVLEADFERNGKFYRMLKAATEGKVFSLLSYNYYNTNIELAILNAYFTGKTLYPSRFEDVNMMEKAREVIRTFTGRDPGDAPIPAYRRVRFPDAGPVEWE